jgi:uncharacterized protein YbjT (DUF2867 family)
MKTIVAGATGLVGKALVQFILAQKETEIVFALSRKEQSFSHPNLKWISGKMPPDALPEADVLVIALGTTMAKAGSKESFWKTDVELPLEIAGMARKSGCKTLKLVSAKGANADSVIFYNKAKGSLEKELANLGFENIVIVRPSLLLGKRDENRPGEKWAQRVLGPLRNWLPASIRPVKAEEVARALWLSNQAKGVKVIENQDIFKFAP